MNANLTAAAKNSKNGTQFTYIIDTIKDSVRAADDNKTFSSDKEVIEYFFSAFQEEFNNPYERRRTPNLQARIADYLRGLPSVCTVAFSDWDIIQTLISWGVIREKDASSARAGRMVSNWFNVCALRIMQIANKTGVNLTNIY